MHPRKYLTWFVLVWPMSGASLLPCMAFDLTDPEAPLAQYELMRGYDAITGGTAPENCFDFKTHTGLGGQSKLHARMRDTQDAASRSKMIVSSLSAEAGVSAGLVNAKAKYSTKSNEETARSAEARKLYLELDFISPIKIETASAISLNSQARSALAGNSDEFSRRCGMYVPVKIEKGIIVHAQIGFTFYTAQEKRSYVESTSGGINASYETVSAAVSAAKDLQENLAKRSIEKQLDVNITVLAESPKGAGKALTSVAQLDQDPIKKAWEAMADLVTALEKDQGGVTSVSFDPVAKYVPGVNFDEAEQSFESAIYTADTIHLVRALRHLREIVRNYRPYFVPDIGARAKRLVELSNPFTPSDTMLVDYVASECLREIDVGFRTALCPDQSYRDFTIEQRLSALEEHLRTIMRGCLSVRSGEKCHKESAVLALIESRCFLGDDDISQLKSILNVNWTSSSGPITEAQVTEMQSARNKMEQAFSGAGQSGLKFASVVATQNLFDPDFLFKSYEDVFRRFNGDGITWRVRVGNTSTDFGQDIAKGDITLPGVHIHSDNRPTNNSPGDPNAADQIAIVFRSPMVAESIVAKSSGKILDRCRWLKIPFGTLTYAYLFTAANNDKVSLAFSMPDWPAHWNDCPSFVNYVVGLVNVHGPSRIDLYFEGTGFWGKEARYVGSILGSKFLTLID